MEEIQIGEYVRNKKGIIYKSEYNISTNVENIPEKYKKLVDNIVKHSKNIIEIIKINDYVNGERVIKIFNPEFLEVGKLPYIITEKSKFEEQEIETILTKEQYENNVFRIGE